MFDKVSSQKLRQLSAELGRIGEQEPSPEEESAVRYARCLSALMECELTDRSWKNENP